MGGGKREECSKEEKWGEHNVKQCREVIRVVLL